MRTWLAEFRDAFAAIFTDRAAFSVMVLAIVVYGLLYPQPYLGEVVREAPVVVVDQDNSATSRELLRRIDAHDTVEIAGSVPDMVAARRALQERRAFAILVIPEFFERDLLAGRSAPVAAYGDASYFLLYNSAMTVVTSVTRQMGAEIAAARMVQQGRGAQASAGIQPMTVTAVPLFNPQGGYASYVVPAAVVLILQQTLLMGVALLNTGAANARYSERPFTAVTARTAAYGLLYGIWMFAYLVFLPAILGVPRIGGLLDLVILGIPFILSTAFLGLLLAAVLPVREWAILAMMAMGIPLFFLSGVAWPVEMLPHWMQRIALAVPSTSAIPGMVRVNQMGASWQDVLTQVAMLWALTAIYGAAALAALHLACERRGLRDQATDHNHG
ncbi:ABC-2 type transport system permease protein [Aureimonas altamirensis DSM 21988]|uniref:ABC-2 type transport system permease protein n=1 Tax=Aureimonas altamirensis DSM 21988 TaxID=1121026 RepID=A0ABY1IPM5_9HYPH|nr:ABC transporter permease [Aureimonas altamirensis]SHJ79143.1 ABC-2 type transport system permease protein [Aureimonas altamirensis DSM 21988]